MPRHGGERTVARFFEVIVDAVVDDTLSPDVPLGIELEAGGLNCRN